MGLLYILSYFAAIAAFLFVTLSLASGLLWAAELIEEHSRIAKTIGQRAIWAIMALHLVLYFDGLPLPQLLFSILCHALYSRNITARWPIISLTSPVFILTCIFVFADHFLWFSYFSRQADLVKQRSRSYSYKSAGSYGKNRGLHTTDRERGFGEIATFFALCIWAVPLFLFLSLSANDNALPTQQDATANDSGITISNNQRTSLLRRILNPALSLLPSKRKSQEPLIAPPSPNPYAASQPYFNHLPAPVPPSPYLSSSVLGTPTMGYNTNTNANAGTLSPGLDEGWTTVPPNLGATSVGLGISPPPPKVRRKVVRVSSGEGKGKDD